MTRYFLIFFLFSCGHTNNKPKQKQSQNIAKPHTHPSGANSTSPSPPTTANAEFQSKATTHDISPEIILEERDILKEYAPRLIFHKNEEYLPSSVQFFLERTKEEEGHYVSKEELNCPDCQNLDFLKGMKPEDKPEIYGFIRERSPTEKELIYFIFYPYNLGKEVCIGVDGLFLDGVFDEIISGAGDLVDTVTDTVQGCLGSKIRFGNHIGDWEHITIRLENQAPQEVFLSAHGHGEAVLWDDIAKKGNHLEAYVALGSHGMYSKAEEHIYLELPNGAQLIDSTNEGKSWDSHENLIFIPEYDIGAYPQEFEWMNFLGRWGNPKEGCEVIESLSGECQLNAGPTGPALKGVLESQNLHLLHL